MESEEILVANMFRVLSRTIDAMGAIEEHLMQGKVGRTMDSKLVNELVSEVEELGNAAVTVIQSKKLLKHRLERELELQQDVGELDPRPMLSQYFVGRTDELKKLSAILSKFGSAAISQYGGIGKTQLMVKFSQNAEPCLPVAYIGQRQMEMWHRFSIPWLRSWRNCGRERCTKTTERTPT